MKKILLMLVSVGILAGCGKDSAEPKIAINQNEVKLKFDQDFSFKIENSSEVKWSSSDSFVGEIDANGVFEAKHIGESIITGDVNGEKLTAKVIVEPYVTDIIEPFLEFGASKAEIKNFEKRNLEAETASAMMYEGQGENEDYVFYSMNPTKLQGSIISFNISSSIATILGRFYGERYSYIGTDDEILYFQSKDKNYVIGISDDDTFGLNAAYFPNSDSKAVAVMKLKNVKKSNLNLNRDILKLLKP